MSKFTKVRRENPSTTIITPGYREIGDIMTIEDEIETITGVNDGTNVNRGIQDSCVIKGLPFQVTIVLAV